MPMSDYLENKMLLATVGNTSYTTPATVYTALSTAAITGNSTPTEPTGNGYSRVAPAFTVTNSTAVNTGNVSYTPTGNAWGFIRSVAVMDASSGGNVLYYGTIAPRNTEVGVEVAFLAGKITLVIS
jgi:hypothetical protein